LQIAKLLFELVFESIKKVLHVILKRQADLVVSDSVGRVFSQELQILGCNISYPKLVGDLEIFALKKKPIIS